MLLELQNKVGTKIKSNSIESEMRDIVLVCYLLKHKARTRRQES